MTGRIVVGVVGYWIAGLALAAFFILAGCSDSDRLDRLDDSIRARQCFVELQARSPRLKGKLRGPSVRTRCFQVKRPVVQVARAKGRTFVF